MRYALRFVILLLALLLLSCADNKSNVKQPYTDMTPIKQIRVYFPFWLDDYPGYKLEAMTEIDKQNIPAEWVVIVELPKFSHPDHGLVRGVCDYNAKTLQVGWRFAPYEDRPLLPALQHEVDHIHGGPNFGH